jgi:hypothetical protein
MKLVRNTGKDRVVDLIRPSLGAGRRLDVVTPSLSLFAFGELLPQLAALGHCRFVLPPDNSDLALFGSGADRPARNRLQARWLASHLGRWLTDKTDMRRAISKALEVREAPAKYIVARSVDDMLGRA